MFDRQFIENNENFVVLGTAAFESLHAANEQNRNYFINQLENSRLPGLNRSFRDRETKQIKEKIKKFDTDYKKFQKLFLSMLNHFEAWSDSEKIIKEVDEVLELRKEKKQKIEKKNLFIKKIQTCCKCKQEKNIKTNMLMHPIIQNNEVVRVYECVNC